MIPKSRLKIGLWRLFLLSAFLGYSPAALPTAAQTSGAEPFPQQPELEVFVREGCPHCTRAKEFLARLAQEQPGLKIAVHDIDKAPDALNRLARIAKAQGATAVRVPAFIINGQMVVGFSEEASTGQLIRNSLARSRNLSAAESPGSCKAEDVLPCGENQPIAAAKPEAFTIDLIGHSVSLGQLGLPLFTLAMGLLDGFNPCSMWVLILMISLLAPMKNRQRMLAIAGTFVAVQGIVYFVFLAAWLNLFLLIGLSRASEILIAALAILAGAINLKDFWAFGRGVSLSIPASTKPGIYARMRRILHAENMAGAIIGVLMLAVLVQIVEFMCTSGFPALFTRILTLRQLDSLSYYGYLLLYDAAYMLDDVIVLAIGIITLSQHRLQEKEGRWLKLISGAVMVVLGIYLLLPPG